MATKLMEEDNMILARGRKKMKFWASFAIGLHARMVHDSILSFVMLKLRREDGIFSMKSTYKVGERRSDKGKWDKQPLEEMYEAWGPIMTDALGPVDRKNTMRW